MTSSKVSVLVASLLMWVSAGLLVQGSSDSVTVSSVKELARVAAASGQHVTMRPGVYQMEDYLTPELIKNAEIISTNRSAMLSFSGSDNAFDFTGVTIEVNTELLNDFGRYVIELSVTGHNNQIKGLTLTDIGNHPTFKGGNSFTVTGDNNVIENVTLNVSGSFPYGYGDLLGKGKDALVDQLMKHSGMLIEGTNIRVIGCSIYSKAFGHCFFVQGGRDVVFEDCYAEAAIRTTDEMLAETSGPAFDANFASVYGNYDGEKEITPGYTKSLSECGFRTYGRGGPLGRSTGAVTAINCRAKNTRIGFAFTKVKGGMLIRDCETIGCEAGYNITGVTIENSWGDAVNGPLLYVNRGDVSKVELDLIPTESTTTVHAIACIAGADHEVTLDQWKDQQRKQVHSILLGATRPSSTNGFCPLGTAPTTGVVLNNGTGLPVELGSTVSLCTVISNGAVSDEGSGNTVELNTRSQKLMTSK